MVLPSLPMPSRGSTVMRGSKSPAARSSTLSTLPPVQAPTPRGRKQVRESVDRRLQQVREGCSLETLRADEVHASMELRTALAELQLNDYFDHRGTPRLRRVGLTLAAKQLPGVHSSFGNWVDDASVVSGGRKEQSAKAYFLATEAIERDMQYGKTRTADMLSSLDAKELHKTDDVQRRQLEVLFSEVPDFEQHLPQSLRQTDMLPPDFTKEEERQSRNLAEKSNTNFGDHTWKAGQQMRWSFSRPQVQLLSQISSLWIRAMMGPSFSVGMDRPTFCRFILDLGLVDQHDVPFFWAVSLFDEVARPMRCCPPDAPLAHVEPLKPVASRWVLISVLDLLCKQHFKTDEKRTKFLLSLLKIAMLRLPAYVIEEGGLNEEALMHLANGEEVPSRAETVMSETRHHRDSVDGNDGEEEAGGAQGAGTRGEDAADEKDVSEQDLLRAAMMRDQRVAAMLVEPEVLHLVAQHEKMFRSLHACYADEHGHMTFAMLLQFCLDFHLVPKISPAHYLEKVYEGALSLDRGKKRPRAVSHTDASKDRGADHSADDSTPVSPSPLSPASESGATDYWGQVRKSSGMQKEARAKRKQAQRKERSSLTSNSSHHKPEAYASTRSAASRGSHGSSPGSEAPRASSPISPIKTAHHIAKEAPEEDLSKEELWPPQLPWSGIAELAEKASQFNKPLQITIVSARGLRNLDRGQGIGNKSDPFCVCSIQRKSGARIETHVINDTLEPVWNYEGILEGYETGDVLDFTIWEKDEGSKAELLGKAQLPGTQFEGRAFSGELLLSNAGPGHKAHITVAVGLADRDPRKFLHGKWPYIFGPGAFAEVLCKIAFTYLGSYGNLQQQATSGFGRVVWLMTFLRSSFVHLRTSLQKRQQEGGEREGEKFGRLQMALEPIPSDLWLSPPDPTLELLPETTFRAALAVQSNQRKASKPPEASNRRSVRGIGDAIVSANRVGRRSRMTSKTRAESLKEDDGEVVRSGSRMLSKASSLERPEAEASVADDKPTLMPDGLAVEVTDSEGHRASKRSSSKGSAAPPELKSSSKGSGGLLESPANKRTSALRSVEGKRQSSAGDADSRQDEHHNQDGPEQEQCVKNGICQLCKSRGGSGEWGNARCRGCSVVDIRAFRLHLLRPLLLDWHPSVRPEAAVATRPLKIERAELTPPPMGRNDMLRG